MTEETIFLSTDLTTVFPDSTTKDERAGYEGYIVDADSLLKVAKYIRDEAGYDYLSSVTAVDYEPDGFFEVDYHLYKTTGGSGLVIKARTPREDATVPSLFQLFPGADFQEREAWDLMGIKFEGHPDLRRILLWEGFAGHPLRKDWHEAYFEDDNKPF